jgi:hypothetical protein
MPSDLYLWQSFKKLTRYDAADSRSVLRHALGAWSFWHECSSAKSHRPRVSSAHRLRHWLDARYVDGDDGRYGLGSLHRHGSDAGSSPSGSRLCLPAKLQHACSPVQPYPVSPSAANFGGGSRGHSRNSHEQLPGTTPRRRNDSNDARSGRPGQPILLVSRSPTSSLPIGRGFGHGRAARPRRSYGALGSVRGKRS